jgi:hypothetical protein
MMDQSFLKGPHGDNEINLGYLNTISVCKCAILSYDCEKDEPRTLLRSYLNLFLLCITYLEALKKLLVIYLMR